MYVRLIILFCTICAGWAVALGTAAPARAHSIFDNAVPASCLAYGDDVQDGDGGTAIAGSDDWTCIDMGSGSTDRTVRMRFDADDLANTAHPTHFVSHIARFEALTMTVVRGPAATRTVRYTPDDIDLLVNGPNFALPLPDMSGAKALVVTVTKPWSSSIASDARLETIGKDGAASLGGSRGMMLAMAFLCGLMLCPLIYNLAFYRVLRKEFILWHNAAVVGMMVYIKTYTGLINYLYPIDISFLLILNPGSFLIAACLGTHFAVKFLEPGMLSRRMKRALIYTGWITLVMLGINLLPIPAFRTFSVTLYSLGFIPLLTIYTLAMVQAARRGSRAVMFQIVGWTPLILLGMERIAHGIGIFEGPRWMGQLFLLSLVFEVLMTSLGVVDRFNSLRRDHERATARLEMLSGLVDRDALTGIYNRRALEQRFAELRGEGFTGIAVVDLDYFKQVNDRYGHTVGDRVLQEVAKALSSDDDALPFRMGGEEFVILLRGGNMQERCERIRAAITIRVANQLDEIDIPVTASMGLVDTPPGTATTMRHLYAQADRLLYEAKNSGRNRIISERMHLFEAPHRSMASNSAVPGSVERRRLRVGRGRRAGDHPPGAS